MKTAHPRSPVGRGLVNIWTFQGRDTRAQFWPYCAVVLGGWVVVSNVLFVAAFIVTSFGSSPRTGLPFIVVTTLSVVVLAALLAAAVTRRLHDRGRSGAWAVVPLVLLGIGLVLFAFLDRTFDEDMGPGLFLACFGVAVLYFAALIALTVQLSMPSVPDTQS